MEIIHDAAHEEPHDQFENSEDQQEIGEETLYDSSDAIEFAPGKINIYIITLSLAYFQQLLCNFYGEK